MPSSSSSSRALDNRFLSSSVRLLRLLLLLWLSFLPISESWPSPMPGIPSLLALEPPTNSTGSTSLSSSRLMTSWSLLVEEASLLLVFDCNFLLVSRAALTISLIESTICLAADSVFGIGAGVGIGLLGGGGPGGFLLVEATISLTVSLGLDFEGSLLDICSILANMLVRRSIKPSLILVIWAM